MDATMKALENDLAKDLAKEVLQCDLPGIVGSATDPGASAEIDDEKTVPVTVTNINKHLSQNILPGYVKSITVKLDKKAAHSETFNLYCEVINPAAIDTIAAKKGADDVDIRDELFCFMERARICGKAGIGKGELLLTVTRETPLSTALQVPLREESGTSLAWVLIELHPVFTGILEHFSPYDASKSPFTSVRQVKYTARFGLPVADVDQKRSILKVWLAKFGEVLPLVAQIGRAHV